MTPEDPKTSGAETEASDQNVELKRWEGGSVPHEPSAFEAKEADKPATGAERKVHAPHAKPAEPLPEGEKPDQLVSKSSEEQDRQEDLLDEGLEESFPASDPVSVKRIT